MPNSATMTIADLLRHTSGIGDHVQAEAFVAEVARRVSDNEDALLPEEAIAFILNDAPFFPAAKGWAYSDTGYLLLGFLVEDATGRSYYDILAERFLVPLRLSATSPSDQHILKGLAVGYTVAGNPFGLPPRTMDVDGRLLWNPAAEWTGGGLVSTSGDLAVWGQALFGGTAMRGSYLERLLDGVAVSPDTPNVLYAAVLRFTPKPLSDRSMAMVDGFRVMFRACAIAPIMV